MNLIFFLYFRTKYQDWQICRLPASQSGRADLPSDRDSLDQAYSHLLRGQESFLEPIKKIGVFV